MTLKKADCGRFEESIKGLWKNKSDTLLHLFTVNEEDLKPQNNDFMKEAVKDADT